MERRSNWGFPAALLFTPFTPPPARTCCARPTKPCIAPNAISVDRSCSPGVLPASSKWKPDREAQASLLFSTCIILKPSQEEKSYDAQSQDHLESDGRYGQCLEGRQRSAPDHYGVRQRR